MQEKRFLPLIQELQSPYSPINHKKKSHSSGYSLDLNKFLPSLKLFKEFDKKKISYYSDSFDKSLSFQKKSQNSLKNPYFSDKIAKKHIKNVKSENLEKNVKNDENQFSFENSREITKKLEFHENLRKIDRISAISVPLSKESFYDEVYMKFFNKFGVFCV